MKAAAMMLIVTLFIQYGIFGGWLLALLVLTIFATQLYTAGKGMVSSQRICLADIFKQVGCKSW